MADHNPIIDQNFDQNSDNPQKLQKSPEATTIKNVSLSALSEKEDKFEKLTHPESDSGDSDEIFEVERILDHHEKPSEFNEIVQRYVTPKEYLVKWKGYNSDYNSWEPFTSLQESCFETICEYERGLANQFHLLELENRLLEGNIKTGKTRPSSSNKPVKNNKRVRRNPSNFTPRGQFIYSLDTYPDFRLWGIDEPIKPTIRKNGKKSKKDRPNKYAKLPDAEKIEDSRNFTYLLKHPESDLENEQQILRIKSSDLQSTEYGQRQMCIYLEHLLLPKFRIEWKRLQEISEKNELPGMIRVVEPDAR